MPRTFIAIEASEEVRDSLSRVQSELEQTGADLNLVKPENIHLTLRFLGDVSESKVGTIANVLKDVTTIDHFQTQVNGLGVFPKPSFIRVIWAGVTKGSKKITYLRKKLDEELEEIGFSQEDKDFTPHFTIARVNSGKAKDKLNSIITEKSDKDWGTVNVLEIQLKKSELTPEGPIYTTLEKAKLGQ